MPYFEKRVNDEGVEELVEVDLAQVDLPEDVVKKHKAYKELSDKDYKKRQRIKELRAQLEAGASEDEETPDGAAPDETVVTTTVTPPVELNEDELFAKFEQRLTAKQQAEAEARKKREGELNALLEKHHLLGSEDALFIVANSSDPAAAAARLEKSQFRFDYTDSGAVPGTDDGDATFANILDGLGLSDKPKK